ncbi:MAG: CDP-glucose 4,6-dehydratase [Lachnospiraceae bacterium]|nr:CDP-glucose 4,6-dehydratase [Lachnospiraceae bacterium]
MNLDFYRGKRVFVTGHTGFKGSWLCRMLVKAGAEVTGYALEPPTTPDLFSLAELEGCMNSVTGDIRDFDHLYQVFQEADPEIVFHLAAQPLVRESYLDPRTTYETNVMGTVNILDCVRRSTGVKSVLNVTTDKVYRNNEWCWGYREDEPLEGFDPYSNSKSCSELVTSSYLNSFFQGEHAPAVSTARAGNVIGGGDFAKDRIIPDCVRAASEKKTIILRNPNSVRPYQHVLEPLGVYLLIAWKQYEDPSLAGSYNVGPDECDCITTGELADLFCRTWGEGMTWEYQRETAAPHEANFLKLDTSKVKQVFGWKPRWHAEHCMEQVVRFSKVWLSGGNLAAEMDAEIEAYLGLSDEGR